MGLSNTTKTALDETRMLILGTQVLLGFQYQVVFRDDFQVMPASLKVLCLLSLCLLTIASALLIAPSMQHRLVERGRDSGRLLGAAKRYAVASLLPFVAALAVDAGVILAKDGHPAIGAGASSAFAALCLGLWIGFPLLYVRRHPRREIAITSEPPKLDQQIQQMLTEARVILPGVQALLGFQLIATFADVFARLPGEIRAVHYLAFTFCALAMALLMTPAALHRIAFQGADDPRFLALGAGFVIAAPLCLAAGLVADIFVALSAAAGARTEIASTVAAAFFVVLLALWYIWPLVLRRRLPRPDPDH